MADLIKREHTMKSDSPDTADALEAFDDFLMQMDSQLAALERDAGGRGIALDLSPTSLAQVERYFDLASANPPVNVDRDSLIIICGRYIGEVVRIAFGGQWKLALDDPDDVNFNMPVIVGHAKSDVEFSPIMVMRAYALRHKPGTIARAVAADVDFTPPRLDDTLED